MSDVEPTEEPATTSAKADRGAAKAAKKAEKASSKKLTHGEKALAKDAKERAKRDKVERITQRFKWEALDDMGNKVSGTETATSAGAVHVALLAKGFQPLEVTAKRNILKFEITKKRVPMKEVMNFSRQLAVFMRAGIPIMEALEVISDETQGKMMRQVLLDIIDSLRGGDTFAGAAAGHPEAFPNYYVGILQSAELTGNLDIVLNQLADYIDRDLKARSKITSALIYPSVVAVMSVVVVAILALFVLPRFVTFFNSLHAKLPLATRMLLGSTGVLHKYWYVFAALIAMAVGLGIWMRRTDNGRNVFDTWILKVPVIGDLTTTAILERTCRILSSLLRAGVDLPRSMTVTADSANNTVYRRGLETIRDEMMEGQGIATPLARTGLFPGAAKQMFRVGEETGTLDQQLETAAEFYGAELETKVDRATSLFEPAIIIFMGLVVGFVAVALISAMYGIYSQVKTG
jgi:type IV pilus assembly protein PilC